MRFYITTLGCPKNDTDSEMMQELLRQEGYQAASSPDGADIVIVNTCGFIAPARQESLGLLRELAQQKKRGQLLIAAGCLAQRMGEALNSQVPGIDAIIGTRSWPEIAALLKEIQRTQRRPFVHVREQGNLVASVRRRPRQVSAYLKIADGCDAACAFCAIPLIKGPQVSKPRSEILREARELVAQGTREIILIAQDTTAYGRDLGDPEGLPGLLHAIASQTPGLRWLRILYAYPQHISPELIEAMATLDPVCHYLDLPLQHGHPDVLRRMRRPHDIDQALRTIEALRQAMPDIALRTTFIVGYPGETEAEFSALLDLMSTVQFDKVGIFCFSPEEGTLAATLPNQVPHEVAQERYQRAMLHQQQISLARNRAQIGRRLTVLIEGQGDGLSVGRSYRDAPEIDGLVLLPGQLLVGTFVETRIVDAQPYDLVGQPLT